MQSTGPLGACFLFKFVGVAFSLIIWMSNFLAGMEQEIEHNELRSGVKSTNWLWRFMQQFWEAETVWEMRLGSIGLPLESALWLWSYKSLVHKKCIDFYFLCSRFRAASNVSKSLAGREHRCASSPFSVLRRRSSARKRHRRTRRRARRRRRRDSTQMVCVLSSVLSRRTKLAWSPCGGFYCFQLRSKVYEVFYDVSL